MASRWGARAAPVRSHAARHHRSYSTLPYRRASRRHRDRDRDRDRGSVVHRGSSRGLAGLRAPLRPTAGRRDCPCAVSKKNPIAHDATLRSRVTGRNRTAAQRAGVAALCCSSGGSVKPPHLIWLPSGAVLLPATCPSLPCSWKAALRLQPVRFPPTPHCISPHRTIGAL